MFRAKDLLILRGLVPPQFPFPIFTIFYSILSIICSIFTLQFSPLSHVVSQNIKPWVPNASPLWDPRSASASNQNKLVSYSVRKLQANRKVNKLRSKLNRVNWRCSSRLSRCDVIDGPEESQLLFNIIPGVWQGVPYTWPTCSPYSGPYLHMRTPRSRHFVCYFTALF